MGGASLPKYNTGKKLRRIQIVEFESTVRFNECKFIFTYPLTKILKTSIDFSTKH